MHKYLFAIFIAENKKKIKIINKIYFLKKAIIKHINLIFKYHCTQLKIEMHLFT